LILLTLKPSVNLPFAVVPSLAVYWYYYNAMLIRVLDPKTVSRIAAGEVVERPASVVKELVENSLDAAATQISVEVRGGGLSQIRVIDDGVGIPAGEVVLAFSRYATSKINAFEDLSTVASLGFRGEALPSIAAVAQVDMVTAAGEALGSHISVRDGAVVKQESQGRSHGTTVTVRNLFRQVPARLKFLKSAATENGHIASILSQYALAFPEIRFSLSVDGRVALRTAGSCRLIDSIISVYGAEVARQMLEVVSGEAGWGGDRQIQVLGMTSAPSVSRSSRGYLSFFVNRRWINSCLLNRALEDAYHGLLMVGRHPIAVINIVLPPEELDVNVHPTKTAVKFTKSDLVFSAVQRAVRRALIEQAPVPRMEEIAAGYGAAVSGPELWAAPEIKDRAAAPAAGDYTPAAALPVLRVLGQLFNSYIIAEGPDGLYLIDQHAAHERILFERIKYQPSQIEVQGLLEPVTIEVSPAQNEVLKSHYAGLGEFGFTIEPFGERTFLVRAVPALLNDKDWAAVLRELMDSLGGEGRGDWQEGLAISMACHGAVRAGQTLTDDEMRELLRQLEQVTSPRACPHGRPTMIQLSSEQLKREFGRT